ncbi:helix-turn-helix domain-containing protein [Anaerobacillus isosaccharinicus]|uniref:Helix-turn-helix domain-containing protein n=1 Tax=Anaerobacillus isosaccharinicus TaxID=1532552 RepID=A0A1S2L685_9BACI|nr:helix-turn-helix domain-containing protein [Anaerobacillus isosaccharinicus]MBA5584984.1 helix-turn-helix domain-containing protein [Anaerobacillus isosaccharinicus]QOY36662.1 helix-turn-helix domain-containing protein [Anaerobacillus isosaccharinicus]
MLKIIIADLEPIQRKSIKMLLQEKYRNQVIVLETEQGQEVIDFVENNGIDLVILDNRLVGLDGLTCAKRIKEKKPYQKLIVYTMSEDRSIKEAYQAIGIVEFLIKPLRPQILIDVIGKVLAQIPETPKRKMNLKIEEILEFIDSHLNQDLTLTYVAERMNFSSYYLSKVFKKELGVNFVKYVTERKMDKAKELLKDDDIPIVNIAFDIGYPEPSYFTKVFKKVENMTPSQYRNQYSRYK